MPIEVDTTSAPRQLIFAVTDPWPSIDEFSSLRQWLIEDGHLTERSRAVIDIRDVSTPSYHDAHAIVAAAFKGSSWPLRRAYLVGSAVQFGFARQLQSLAPASMEIEIFTSADNALEWLRLSG